MSPRRFLLIFGLGFLSIFALVGGILLYTFSNPDFLESPGIELALARARSDARVVGLLGEPLQKVRSRGGVSRGSVNSVVDVELGLGGPRGQADLSVVGFQLGKGPWEFSAIELTQGDKRLDLLKAE